MRLNEMQAQFKDMILAPDDPGETFADVFESNDIPLSNRLDVYRNNFMSGLGNAMIANFPLLEKLVGRDFLLSMIRDYVRANPPSSGCLTFYGQDFDRFVAGFAPAAHLPYLPHMAKLEVLINQSYHAKDETPLNADDLAVIPANELEEFELKLRDSVQLLQSSWPLDKIRTFCLDENQGAPDINSGGTCLLIYRAHLDVEIVAISESEYNFLNALKPKALGEAVADTLSLYPDFDFQSTLQRHIKLQIFLKPEKT